MNKTILYVMLTLSINVKGNSVEENSNIFNSNNTFFSNSDQLALTAEVSLENPDIESKTPPFIALPINDYLPLLAVAAVGLGLYYRKELKQITK